MAIGWGSMSMIQAATTSFAGMMVVRFVVGVFEAGFAPGVALYLSFFYHRREMGLRYGLFISFSPLASCFASAMAYGIVQAKTSIENWQLLFLVGKYLQLVQQTSYLLIMLQRELLLSSLHSSHTSTCLMGQATAQHSMHTKTRLSVLVPVKDVATKRKANLTSSKSSLHSSITRITFKLPSSSFSM